MFAELVEATRHLRDPLTAGYSTIFAIWIVARDNLAEQTAKSPLLGELAELLGRFGFAANIGLLTFAALMIGSLVDRGAIKPITRFLEQLIHRPNWEEYIKDARQRATKAVQHTTKSTTSGSSRTSISFSVTLPSPTKGDLEIADYEARKRDREEAQYRVVLLLNLYIISLALLWENDLRMYLVLFGLSVVASLYWLVTIRSTVRTMYLSEREALETDLQTSEARVESEEKNLAEVEPDSDANIQFWANEVRKAKDDVDAAARSLKGLEKGGYKKYYLKPAFEGRTRWILIAAVAVFAITSSAAAYTGPANETALFLSEAGGVFFSLALIRALASSIQMFVLDLCGIGLILSGAFFVNANHSWPIFIFVVVVIVVVGVSEWILRQSASEAKRESEAAVQQ